MAGIEVLGVIASVGQIIHYGGVIVIGLHDLYQQAQRAPERYAQLANQVEQLVQTARLIAETEALKTDLIARHLETLLDTVKNLHRTLSQALKDTSKKPGKRCWRAIWSAHREDKISKGFSQLEENKSSLALCILGTYGGFMMPAIQKTGGSASYLEGEVHRSRAKSPRVRAQRHNLEKPDPSSQNLDALRAEKVLPL
ncbi:uncharacterized protein BDZ99DRAFT_45505 [Mytilinidion resinicola]|uniref:Fungal N-terminal domain-containing protein n=1 Tax=Mytilinidion resinicola TaxID=574789 RepID=A0A6A6YKM3_9PEZI|nr:uncharacterized protein BDZ99DRAFT_45505 [Mytilinidion resinicola]KAF2809103.1 hypothetical protein BDZ99DRAFT_45505 [Mytilinidion resinicola]